MQQDVIFSDTGRALSARPRCEIDHHAARRIREIIDAQLFEKKPELLILDFSEVKFMDSSGLGLILGRVEKVGALGGRTEVRGLSDSLYKLVRLCGIEKVKNLSVIKQ